MAVIVVPHPKEVKIGETMAQAAARAAGIETQFPRHHQNSQVRRSYHRQTSEAFHTWKISGADDKVEGQPARLTRDTEINKKPEETQAKPERVIFQSLALTEKTCLLLGSAGDKSLPREIRDIIWELVLASVPSFVRGRLTPRPGLDMIPRCFRTNFQMYQEAFQVILRKVRVVIHTGRDMFAFKKWIDDYHVHEYVRHLEFPQFHCFNPGQLSGVGRLYPMGAGDIELMLACLNLRRVTFKLRCARMTCDNMVQRYSLEKLAGCRNLQELSINLTARSHGAATDFDEGEKVAQYCRNMFQNNNQTVRVTTNHSRGR